MVPPPDANADKDKRDAEYRRRILDAARRLMEQHGTDAVNMYQIAQEAGIGQGTLYRRFEHTGEIYSELLRTNLEHFVGKLEADFAGSDGSEQSDRTDRNGLPALDRLEACVARLVDYIDENADFLYSINCMYASKKDAMPFMRPSLLRLRKLLNHLLQQAIPEHQHQAIDTRLYTHFIIMAIMPESYMYVRRNLGYDKERLGVGIRQLFIDNLRQKETTNE